MILETQRRITHPVSDIDAVTKLETVLEMQKLIVQVHISPAVRTYILDLTEETRKDERIQLGVSPRGSLALYKGAQALAAIRGRDYVIPEYLIKSITPEQILAEVIERVEVPVLKGAL